MLSSLGVLLRCIADTPRLHFFQFTRQLLPNSSLHFRAIFIGHPCWNPFTSRKVSSVHVKEMVDVLSHSALGNESAVAFLPGNDRVGQRPAAHVCRTPQYASHSTKVYSHREWRVSVQLGGAEAWVRDIYDDPRLGHRKNAGEFAYRIDLQQLGQLVPMMMTS